MENLPSRGFAKLDSGIVDSTLWMKDNDVLRVWIALLAKSDSLGIVRASVPTMAHLCFTTLERFETIIGELCAPDPHSRTSSHEGRRLSRIEGGWCILNYIFYREMMQRKAMSHAERQARYRERVKQRDAGVTAKVTRDTEAEAEAEAEAVENLSTPNGVEVETDVSPCPVQQIVSIYHETLPMLPRVEKITKTRRGLIQQRWREDLKTIDAWRNYFAYVAKSAFLTGRTEGSRGRPPFRADLEWLSRPANYSKIAEEKYHVEVR